MTEFTNGDVLRHKTQHSKVVTYVGRVPNDDKRFVAHAGGLSYVPYLLDEWELKPTRKKRWIAVWKNSCVYNSHFSHKGVLQGYVERDYSEEHAAKAQYIQIEVEV